jgi:hypothetical protein
LSRIIGRILRRNRVDPVNLGGVHCPLPRSSRAAEIRPERIALNSVLRFNPVALAASLKLYMPIALPCRTDDSQRCVASG